MMYCQKSDNLELVTIIDCVCADGTADIPACFIFKGAGKFPEWMEVDDDILIATSDNGWTDDECGFEWFRQCFIPHAQK
ncbi:hypothetical protein GYMLUDRAFT_167982 [Collybiopsis luxurians FD-317 M1]|uniref:Unplaced genomic scaffold GYMLUscaffold_27, whole genome shotgun sequence n=1 Tax=Collybiopsis luxurians FD-317 M1 TaxID=944289 RepID=A0A0D0CCY4_9AGAR|nr:hypothetical protein GYMLUDRAFT_167982 [Collybiopsis luxurians FD-317 M1]